MYFIWQYFGTSETIKQIDTDVIVFHFRCLMLFAMQPEMMCPSEGTLRNLGLIFLVRRKTEIILHKIIGFPSYEFQPASIFRRFYFWLQESWNNDLRSIFVSSITKYLNEQHVTFYICWGSSSDYLFVWILRAGCTKTPLPLVQLSLVLARALIDNLKCLFSETGKHRKKNNCLRSQPINLTNMTSESSWCKNTSPALCNPTICFIGLLVLLI